MDIIVDIVAMTTFTGYGAHSQRMLGNLAQHRKWRSAVSQSDWHKVGSVDGRSANRRSRTVIGDRKSMEKRNTVDRQSILNIKLIEDQ